MSNHKTEWLANASPDQLSDVMLRYALRALPAVSPKNEQISFGEEFFLRHARCLISACALKVLPSERLRSATAYGAFAAGDYTGDQLQTAASVSAKAAASAAIGTPGYETEQIIYNAIELLPHSDFHRQAQWDMERLSTGSGFDQLSSSPLWTMTPEFFRTDQQLLIPDRPDYRNRLRFWLDWYQGFLEGRPLDWELQRRVALIEDTIWDAGPEAVANEIEKIQALFNLEQDIAALKKQLAANATAPSMIGDNGGPPLEDAASLAVQKDIQLVREQVARLESEITKPEPSPSVLNGIARRLFEISKRIAAYCGEKMDLVLTEAAKETGKAVGKWGAPLAILYATQNESIRSLAQAIKDYVITLP